MFLSLLTLVHTIGEPKEVLKPQVNKVIVEVNFLPAHPPSFNSSNSTPQSLTLTTLLCRQWKSNSVTFSRRTTGAITRAKYQVQPWQPADLGIQVAKLPGVSPSTPKQSSAWLKWSKSKSWTTTSQYWTKFPKICELKRSPSTPAISLTFKKST